MKITFKTSNKKESVTSKTFKIVSSKMEGVWAGVGLFLERTLTSTISIQLGTFYKKISLVIRTLVYQETLHDHS